MRTTWAITTLIMIVTRAAVLPSAEEDKEAEEE